MKMLVILVALIPMIFAGVELTLVLKDVGETRREAKQNALKKVYTKIYLIVKTGLNAKEQEICDEHQLEIVGKVKSFILETPEILKERVIKTLDIEPLEQVKMKVKVLFDANGFKKWLREFVNQYKKFYTVIFEIEDNLEVLPENIVTRDEFKNTIEQAFINKGFDVRYKGVRQQEINMARADEDIDALIHAGRRWYADFVVRLKFRVSLKKKQIYGTGVTTYEARCTANGTLVKLDTNKPYKSITERRKARSLDLEEAVRGAVILTAKKVANNLGKFAVPTSTSMTEAIDFKVTNIAYSQVTELKKFLKSYHQIKNIKQVSISQRGVDLSIRTLKSGDWLMKIVAEIFKEKLFVSFNIVRSSDNYIWLRLDEAEFGEEDDF